jgi:threonine synthase
MGKSGWRANIFQEKAIRGNRGVERMAFRENWQWPFQCIGCGNEYPLDSFPYCCPQCGSIFEFNQIPTYDPGRIEKQGSGIERFRSCFPLPPDAEFITLGEGNTPLVEMKYNQRRLFLKCEHLNPTGSFKDRGTAILLSALKYLGIAVAVEDSSGNAGASFAAYATHAGIHARVFVPAYASGPKREQIEAYGAEVISVPGPRSAASQAVLEEVGRGAVYASHAYLPHGISGMATVAYELIEQLGRAPGTVIAPVGQGSLLLGLSQGFRSLFDAGLISYLPHLIAVQSKACAPVWSEFHGVQSNPTLKTESETIAEGIRILNPLRLDGVIASISDTQGDVVVVDEEQIVSGWKELARNGFYIEPTSAVVWAGMIGLWDQIQEPIVLILTGSGLKSSAPDIT